MFAICSPTAVFGTALPAAIIPLGWPQHGHFIHASVLLLGELYLTDIPQLLQVVKPLYPMLLIPPSS